MHAASGIALKIASHEFWWWTRRVKNRLEFHTEARKLADYLGRPLVVIGAPDRGMTGSPGGDIVIDIGESKCANFIQADICKPLPLKDNFCVCYVACVLEYVEDVAAAMRELLRISGGLLYVVHVEPWTLTAYCYPGARRTVPSRKPSEAEIRRAMVP